MEASERAALNREHANMYRSLADLTNNTSDGIQIFMRLYAVSNFNQCRLVKQMMTFIFKMDLCQALTSYNADSSLGIFGGEEHVMKTLEETKKQRTLVKSTLLTTKKARKTDKKSGKNRSKKPAAGGTKAKGKGKGAKKKAGAKPKAKAASDNNKDWEVSSAKGKDKV